MSMKKTLVAIIAATSLAGCQTITNSSTSQLQKQQNTQEKPNNQNIIQIIPHYFHVSDKTIQNIITSVEQTTNIDSIVTDRGIPKANNPNANANEQIIVAYTKGQTETLLSQELDAYMQLTKANFSFLLEYEKVTNNVALNAQSRKELSKILDTVEPENSWNLIQEYQLSLKQIEQEKKERTATILDYVVKETQYSNNIALLVHAHLMKDVTNMLADGYRVSIVTPSGSEIDEFDTKINQDTYEVQTERYKIINSMLENVILKDAKLRTAYIQFVNDGTLPKAPPEQKPEYGPYRQNQTEI